VGVASNTERNSSSPPLFFLEMVVGIEIPNHSLIYVLLAESTGFYELLAIMLFLNNFLPPPPKVSLL